MKNKGAVAFRHNRIKNEGHCEKTQCLSKICANLRNARSKTCGFPQFFYYFYSIAVSFLSVYVYTPSGRRTAISALNPYAPGSVLIKNLLGIQFSPYFLRFCIDFPKFLMRQNLLLYFPFSRTCLINVPILSAILTKPVSLG